MVQPEARLSRAIMGALRARGAFVFKVWGSEHMMAGLPDILGVYRGQFIGVEAKMPGNKTSLIQDRVIGKIRQAGGRVVVAYTVAEALEVLDGGVTPGNGPEALTGELRAPSALPHRRTTGQATRELLSEACLCQVAPKDPPGATHAPGCPARRP